MQTLNNLYRGGLIPYSRVENSYIDSLSIYSYFPHTPLPIINPYFEPLKMDEYPFEENSLLLHLHNLRIITPSTYKIKDKVDSFKKDTEKSEKVLERYKRFVDSIERDSIDYFIKDELSHYRESSNAKFYRFDYYKIKNIDDVLALNNKILAKTIKEEKDFVPNPIQSYIF